MQTMRAAAIDRFGGPEVLVTHDVPVPKISAQEVLIAVHTAGAGIWDAKARQGEWFERKEFPFIPGTDGSGVIEEVGAQVKRLKAGDRVYSYSYDNPKGGFYAEYVAV
jgi:NADPH2:quinone reductase